jgi:glycosyltransferase involved in cell wall biosynthesis
MQERRRVRVALVIDHYFSDLAGTEHQVMMMVQGLSDRLDIDLICLRDSEWLRTRAAALPCRITLFQIDNFRALRTYREIGRFVQYLRRSRPDVVHTFFPVANIIGILAARLAGIPNTVSSRRDYGEWMSPRYLIATRMANVFVRRIVTNSHEVKRLTMRKESFPESRIEVIYNGIDVESFRSLADDGKLRQALGIAPGQKIVGLVANYRPMKRQATLVRAASVVAQHRDDVDFVLVGDNAVEADLKGQVRALVHELGLDSRVHFAHASGNVRQFLAMFNVGVNCSEGEGLSNAVMEYMAASVPCVVSASGGNPDLIAHEKTGLTFALGDHEALAAAIVRVLDDPATSARFVAAALHKVTSEMSLQVMVQRLHSFYAGFLPASAEVPATY